MDYEMETLIQAFEIQINMVWNQFHGIIHELIRYAHALVWCPLSSPTLLCALSNALPPVCALPTHIPAYHGPQGRAMRWPEAATPQCTLGKSLYNFAGNERRQELFMTQALESD